VSCIAREDHTLGIFTTKKARDLLAREVYRFGGTGGKTVTAPAGISAVTPNIFAYLDQHRPRLREARCGIVKIDHGAPSR
jgi:hypothetical protein